MLNDSKEVIICEGDFLPASVTSSVKNLVFDNCPYSFEETSQNFILSNRGLNKVWFRIKNSSAVRVSPESGIISDKGKQEIKISFHPSELPKQYFEQITI